MAGTLGIFLLKAKQPFMVGMLRQARCTGFAEAGQQFFTKLPTMIFEVDILLVPKTSHIKAFQGVNRDLCPFENHKIDTNISRTACHPN